MRMAGSSDPTAMGLPCSLSALSELSDVSELPSAAANAAISACSLASCAGSTKASYSASWKKSSESGSKRFKGFHLSHPSALSSGSVLIAGAGGAKA